MVKLLKYLALIGCVFFTIVMLEKILDWYDTRDLREIQHQANNGGFVRSEYLKYAAEVDKHGWDGRGANLKGTSEKFVFLFENSESFEGQQIIADRVLELEEFFDIDVVYVEGIIEDPTDSQNFQVIDEIERVLEIDREANPSKSPFAWVDVETAAPFETAYVGLFQNNKFETVGFEDFQSQLDSEIFKSARSIIEEIFMRSFEEPRYLAKEGGVTVQMLQLKKLGKEMFARQGAGNAPSIPHEGSSSLTLEVSNVGESGSLEKIEFGGVRSKQLSEVIKLTNKHEEDLRKKKTVLAMKRCVDTPAKHILIIAELSVLQPIDDLKGDSIAEALIAQGISYIMVSEPEIPRESDFSRF